MKGRLAHVRAELLLEIAARGACRNPLIPRHITWGFVGLCGRTLAQQLGPHRREKAHIGELALVGGGGVDPIVCAGTYGEGQYDP
jgi:hypothetical protein